MVFRKMRAIVFCISFLHWSAIKEFWKCLFFLLLRKQTIKETSVMFHVWWSLFSENAAFFFVGWVISWDFRVHKMLCNSAVTETQLSGFSKILGTHKIISVTIFSFSAISLFVCVSVPSFIWPMNCGFRMQYILYIGKKVPWIDIRAS